MEHADIYTGLYVLSNLVIGLVCWEIYGIRWARRFHHDRAGLMLEAFPAGGCWTSQQLTDMGLGISTAVREVKLGRTPLGVQIHLTLRPWHRTAWTSLSRQLLAARLLTCVDFIRPVGERVDVNIKVGGWFK